MKLKSHLRCVAFAAVTCGLVATEARAILRYDLRFASGPGVTPGTKQQFFVSPGIYTLNLYAVIDQGTGGYADDSITGGFVNIYSSSPGNHLLSAGSGITRIYVGSRGDSQPKCCGERRRFGTNPNFNIFTPEVTNADNTAPASAIDGVLDWGSDQTYFGSLAFSAPNQGLQVYTKDGVNGTAASVKFGFAPPFVPGGQIGNAHLTIPNAWEVLIGTYTVAVNGINAPGRVTVFSPWTYHRVRATGASGSAIDGMAYNQDGANNPPGRLGTRLIDIPDLFSGVVFGIPEPSTVVVSGLVAIGSFFAFRRQRISVSKTG